MLSRPAAVMETGDFSLHAGYVSTVPATRSAVLNGLLVRRRRAVDKSDSLYSHGSALKRIVTRCLSKVLNHGKAPGGAPYFTDETRIFLQRWDYEGRISDPIGNHCT